MSTDNSAFFLLNKKIQEWIYKNEWEELRPAQVESIKEIRQKSNNLIICSPTASGKTEAAMLPLISELLEKDSLIFVSGTLSTKNQDKDILKIICNKLYALNNIRDKITKSFNIIFDESRSKNELEEIKNIVSNNKGKYPFIIHFKYGKNQFQKIKSRRYLVSNQQSLLKKLRKILGEKNVWLS